MVGWGEIKHFIIIIIIIKLANSLRTDTCMVAKAATMSGTAATAAHEAAAARLLQAMPCQAQTVSPSPVAACELVPPAACMSSKNRYPGWAL